MRFKYSIVMTGFIGLEGTAKLAKEYEKRITERFPAYLVKDAAGFGDGDDRLGHEKALEIIGGHLREFGAVNGEGAHCVEVSKGGILTALYELATISGLGFETDLRKIPIRQETVEICELLEVNPYHLYSGKCMVCMVPEGGALVTGLQDEGINAVIIGHTTDKKAHILYNDGTESHLNRPEPDELERLALI